MTNLERLKLELSNKEYYSDDEYKVFLEENNLVPTDTYVKADNQIQLLETVVSVLETLSNDVDIMRKIDNKDIVSVDQASKYLSQRIYNINKKILDLKEEQDDTGNISFLFYN